MINFKPKKNIVDYINEQRELNESRKNINRTLHFKGYYETNDDIPASHGVYVAFALDYKGEMPPRLLYIGRAYKSNNLKKRVGEHISDDHGSKRWLAHYNPKEENILYSYVEIDDDVVIPDIEKTLIHINRPDINDNEVENNMLHLIFFLLN